jgi:hypothetical protein
MHHHDYRKLIRPLAGGLALVAAGALTLGTSPAGAAARVVPRPPKTVYAVTFASNSALYRINPRSHRVSLVGHTKHQLTDIAFRGKTLNAISFTALYRLNPKTGASHLIGSLGLSNANALAAQPKTHTLYGADQSGDFFKIRPKTGRVTIIGFFGHGLGSSGDLTFSGGHLYATVFRSGSVKSLLARVNIHTGAAKVIGNTGHTNVYGLITGRGALYGATFNGRFLKVSRTTGRGRVVWKDGLHVGGLTVP